MSMNVGSADRYVRGAAGIALMVYGGFVRVDVLGFVLAAVGMVLLATAIASSCPIYTLLGLNTCGRKHPH